MSNITAPSNQNSVLSPKGWYVTTSGAYSNGATTAIIRVGAQK